ncbi:MULTISPECIES: LysR family transcriptional regulator [Pseudomonas]|uniref:LysR family transcriptional regulator n=1 Tax=Pseudomonas TaxID=286 RepID=UPI001EEFC475|nr:MULTISPECIES: LysR family transcriptional regulator [Pseudomonas]MCF3193218.1 LysR family transcriptional regulator [Pseudomonas bubulae]MCF6761779.1 LysR family transcriptional regulator [Pseudomonas fragi]
MSPDFLNNHHSDEIAAFLAIASQGSFVGAGRQLQRHPTVVSKRLAAMEKRLGVRLVERSTRKMRMTEAGIKLEQRLRAAIELISEAQQQAAQSAREVRGTLRLALPAAMGRRWIGPLLAEFLKVYPHVSILADYSERLVDIIDDGFDAAIRIGELQDNRLIARKLSDHRRILCASPAYISEHGMPLTPQDLVRHNCLRFSGLASFPQWRLHRGNALQTVSPKGNMTANDSEALLAAALADAGILGAGDWLMAGDIAAGRLVHVLADWQLDTAGGVYLVRPSAKFPSAVVVAFKEWIESKFIPAPPWAN